MIPTNVENFDELVRPTTPAVKLAHACALHAWHQMDLNEAVQYARTQTCEQLDAQTYAGGSIAAAKAGIEKHLLGGKKIDEKYLTADSQGSEADRYFFDLSHEMDDHLKRTNTNKYDGVMDILADIHNQWVTDNAKKYNRNDNLAFQHLPFECLTLEEAAKDAMFLEPILENIGTSIGAMDGKGHFIPNSSFNAAFGKYQEAHLGKDLTKDNLTQKVTQAIHEYAPLQGNDEMSKARRDYMAERTDLLTREVAQNVLTDKVATLSNCAIDPNEFGINAPQKTAADDGRTM